MSSCRNSSVIDFPLLQLANFIWLDTLCFDRLLQIIVDGFSLILLLLDTATYIIDVKL